MKKIILIFIAMMIGVTANAGERLKASEIKEVLTDQTFSALHIKLGPAKVYYGADGSVRRVSDDGSERKGKWWVDEDFNLRCVRWDDKDKNFCHYVEKNDDGTYTIVHSKKGTRIVEMKSRQAGNQL